MSLNYDNITQVQSSGTRRAGKLKLDAAGGEFEQKTGKKQIFTLKETNGLSWQKTGDGLYQLSFNLKGAGNLHFHGFKADQFDELEKYAKDAGKTLDIVTRSAKGLNWGEVKHSPAALQFEVDGGVAFDLPYSTISQAVIQGKNEVALELHQSDFADQNSSLTELRFYVPPVVDEKTGEEIPAVEDFNKQIVERADLGGQQQESIASFANLMFQVPRGKYLIELYPSYLKLHGQTFHYKILYKSIVQLMLFENPDSQSHFFIVGLNPPVRQGQTPYPYLVIQFKSNEQSSLTVNMEEKKIEEKYAGLLSARMQGATWDIVSRVFKALTGRKLIVPGSFKSAGGAPCVRANYKSNDGHLYILEKSFFYLKKPTLFIRHDEIESVEFQRLSNSSTVKTFDLSFTVKGLPQPHTFTSINKTEYEPLFDFLQNKKLLILNVKDQRKMMASSAAGRMRAAVDYAGADGEDPYLAKLKAEADAEGGADSEEDDDYVAPAGESSSSSESDAPSDAEDGEGKKGKKRKSEAGDDGPKKKKRKTKDKSEKGEKKAKKPKKSGKGKGTQGAFGFYCTEVRPDVARANPDMKPQDVTKKLGEMWKELKPEERLPFEELAQKAAARHSEAMKDAEADGDGGAGGGGESEGEEEESDGGGGEKKKKKKKEKRDGEPKKPASAYLLWSTEYRPELKKQQPALTFGEVGKELGRIWKEKSTDEKAPYEERAKAAKAKYQVDLAEFEKAEEAAGRGKSDKKKDKEKKKDKKEKKKDKDKEKSKTPKSPSKSAGAGAGAGASSVAPMDTSS